MSTHDTHLATFAVSCLALGLVVGRLYSLVRANIWLWQHGLEYAAARDALPEVISNEEREELYLQHRGNYLPFGVKGVRVRRWARYGNGRVSRKLRGWLARVVVTLWAFYVFCPLAGAYICWRAVTIDPSDPVSVGDVLDLISAYLLLACTMLLSSEAVLSYLKIRSWGRLYHGLAQKERGSTAELSVAVGDALVTLTASVSLLAFIARFDPSSFSALKDSSSVALLGDSLYYAFVCLAQFGDPGPLNGLGKSSVGLVKLTGLVFVVVVVALVVSSVTAGVTQTKKGSGDVVRPGGAQEIVDVQEAETVSGRRSWTAAGIVVGAGVVSLYVIRVFIR